MIRRSLSVAIALALGNSAALAQDIEEIAVVGNYVPDEKRNTSAVSNVLTREEFSRSGDSNIAEGLKRVAGLSLVGGKFIYVRGLGERYSSALLNGSQMPSPEPMNRALPLDLFPGAIMDSVVVQKTYSAQFPSEFGGGVLQMRTRTTNDEFFFNVSSSVGMTDGVSFSKGLSANGGSRDWLARDDGSRAMPDLLKQATADRQRLQRGSRFLDNGGYTGEELQAIGRSLPNDYDLSRESLPLDVNVSASVGNSHYAGESVLSYLAAIDYKNNWSADSIARNSYKVGGEKELVRENAFTYNSTVNDVDISSIFSASLEFSMDHTISATTIALLQSEDRAAELVGFFGDEAMDSKITEIEFIERGLTSHQLEGEHYFPDANELTLGWRYNRSSADRDTPDTREYRYDLTDQGYRFNLRSDGNVHRYSELDDSNSDFGVDSSMIFYWPADATITLSAGYSAQESDRDYQIRRFSFFERSDVGSNPGLLYQPLSHILSPGNIGPDGFELGETTRPTDTYTAQRELESYYVQAEFNLSDRFRLLAGLRQEDYEQSVGTFDLFRPADVVEARLDSKDVLPSMTATYIHGDHQFRLGYSETTSRPDFRELSPAAFTNPLTGYEEVGNPDLQVAYIENFDLRWEWYFNRLDSLSVGVFQKNFERPIEVVVEPGANSARSFVNAEAAQNRGIEVELQKQLDFMGERWADFYIAGNLSFIDSEVTIGNHARSIVTNTSRPLQGQSDWLFNAQLGYDGLDGTTATLLYNYVGDRIYEVGILGAPDLIEEGRGELDFVLQKEIGSNWNLSLKAQNLLDENKDITQGGLLATGYREGRSVSMKVEYQL